MYLFKSKVQYAVQYPYSLDTSHYKLKILDALFVPAHPFPVGQQWLDSLAMRALRSLKGLFAALGDVTAVTK